MGDFVVIAIGVIAIFVLHLRHKNQIIKEKCATLAATLRAITECLMIEDSEIQAKEMAVQLDNIFDLHDIHKVFRSLSMAGIFRTLEEVDENGEFKLKYIDVAKEGFIALINEAAPLVINEQQVEKAISIIQEISENIAIPVSDYRNILGKSGFDTKNISKVRGFLEHEIVDLYKKSLKKR